MLKELYHKKKMSMGDIAKRFGCSRAYILKLCKKYGISVKTKSLARRMAYSTGKKIRYKPINRNFFKKWTNEMAYVLGFIYADGSMSHQLDYFSISQKEKEILEKIKRLMQAEHVIIHHKHQDLYTLYIGAGELVKDLVKLGVTPRKSLTIKFPDMPEQCVSHFIRGYFDGDGSINLDGRVSFVTGSREFIESIKEKLEKLELAVMAKIHKHKTANAYAIYYHRKADVIKIFKFFYDEYTLRNELYLNRKYERFKKALGLTYATNDLFSS
jgi:DNA-binding transcriptional regulator WhiA